MKEPHGEVVSALESVERIVCVTAERGDHRAAAKQREPVLESIMRNRHGSKNRESGITACRLSLLAT